MTADFLRTLFGVSLTGGIFIIAAFLVRAGMKQRLPKHFLVLLWAAVLLHLLFIAGTPSPTSVYNYVMFRSPVNLVETEPSARGLLPEDAGTVGHVESPALDSADAAPFKVGGNVYTVLFIVWVAGAVVFLAIFTGSYWATRRRFGDAFLLKNNPAVNAWLKGRKFPPKVFVSDRTTTPLSYGLIRPHIILPSGFDLDNIPQLESVLEHEYVHCRNHHNVLKVLASLAVLLHWFNPAIWLYWFLFNHDLELACDERVIRAIGPGRRAEYAHSLVAVAERAVIPFPLVSAFSARNLKERIVDVMGYKRTTIPLLVAEIALVAALFALFGTTSIRSAPAPATTQFIVPEIASAPTETTVLPPELVQWSYPAGADPLAVALSLTGDGLVVKRKTDDERGGEKHEFVILSGGHEYKIELDARSRSVVKYERKNMKKPFATADPGRFITMERAARLALDEVGGGVIAEFELKHVKPDRFVYEIEILADGGEYEVEIDAVSGRTLEVDVDSKPRKKPGHPRKPHP